MSFGSLCIISILGVLGAVWAGKATEAKQSEDIARTKILATNQRFTGRLNGSWYTETTFMLYLRDGTHKATTVKNGSNLYNIYMGKLEG